MQQPRIATAQQILWTYHSHRACASTCACTRTCKPLRPLSACMPALRQTRPRVHWQLEQWRRRLQWKPSVSRTPVQPLLVYDWRTCIKGCVLWGGDEGHVLTEHAAQRLCWRTLEGSESRGAGKSARANVDGSELRAADERGACPVSGSTKANGPRLSASSHLVHVQQLTAHPNLLMPNRPEAATA